MTHTKLIAGIAFAATIIVAAATPTNADPIKCQKTVAKSLASYKQIYLKMQLKCWNLVNLGDFPAPCPGDPLTSKFAEDRDQAREGGAENRRGLRLSRRPHDARIPHRRLRVQHTRLLGRNRLCGVAGLER